MIVKLTEEIVRSMSTAKSFERGQEYYQSGALDNTARQGNVLTGKCQGSGDTDYWLRVELDTSGIHSASCTCPFEYYGYCKHLVALLLMYIHEPEGFVHRKGIKEMLSELDHDELIVLIEKMTERDLDMYDWLEMTISTIRASIKAERGQSTKARKTQVSAQVYRRQVKNILHSLDGYRMSEAYWMMGGMIQQLRQVVDSAGAVLEAGDAEGALIILVTLLEELAESYGQFDDSDGDLADFLGELGQPLAEAILTADLSIKERKELEDDLGRLISDLRDYGIEGLEVALVALKQGWVEGDEEGSYQDEVEWYGGVDLIQVKLNVLERQGQVDEYLALCHEVGEYGRYALKLVELGRIEEGIGIALSYLTSVEDILVVAQALRAANHMQDALVLGERGLLLVGNKHTLGSWLGPIEEAQGRIEQAFQAYQAAFDGLPSLELYTMLKRLAGSRWHERQPILIKTVRASQNSNVLADVYLAEEEWDSAIRTADQKAGDFSLIEKVADAVIASRPEWVIRVSCNQAEGLIEKTQSKYYAIAARWLAKAKKASIQASRKAEWEAYLANLKRTYSRRPALQAELRRL
jgi:uncharacterized Zn finger protein